MTLSQRSTESELMDEAQIGLVSLKEVFKDINTTNKLLGGDQITIDAVSKLIEEHPQKSYTILDLGCGDGNMLRELSNSLRKGRLNIDLVGLEIRDDVVKMAIEKSKDYPEISYVQGDILNLDPEKMICDIVLCTLTLHHFDNDKIPELLKSFTRLAKIGVVINDLQRSRLACYLFRIFRVLFLKTKVAKHDGLVSIRSAFKKSELLAFSKQIPNAIHHIKWKWAFRYVWIITPKRLN